MFTEKRKFFAKSLALVCGACLLPSSEVMHGRGRDASDARWVLVAVLCGTLTDTEIGRLIGRTRQGVCHIRNNVAKSRDRVLRAVAERIMEQVNSK